MHIGLKRIYLEEEGSIIVEAGVIMPIVLVVLLLLMTLVLWVHDIYIGDVASQIVVNRQAGHVGTSKELEDDLNKKMQKLSYIKAEEVSVTYKDDLLTLKRQFSIPLLSGLKSIEETYRIDSMSKLDRVRIVELGMDMFEAINVSDEIRKNFGSGIKALKTILKNN